MFVYIQGAVENSKDVNRLFVPNEVGDAIMTIEQYADVLVWIFFVAVTHLGKLAKHLDPIVNPKNYLPGGFFIVPRNVVVDLLEPGFRLVRPLYFRHRSICRFITSLLTVRPLSES